MNNKNKPGYRPDYKTDDAAWWKPPNPALRSKLVVKFKKLVEQAKVPQYKSAQAAGMDVSSAVETTIPPGKTAIVSTGLAMSIPDGYECQVRPRSGLAAKKSVTVLNSPGTIDADYRGEVKVILINHGSEDFSIEVGDRIAQLVISKVEQPSVRKVEVLDETERGSDGLGSTGVK